MIVRIKQFFCGLFAKITKNEHDLIKNYLTKEEQILFYKLQIFEQKHCLNVANDIKKDFPNNKSLIRIGLLHDIGKIKCPLSLIDKSIVVLLDKVTKSKIKSFNHPKILCYYNHAFYSYEILKNLKISKEELFVILNHHNKSEDEKICQFQFYDDKY